MQQKNSQKPGPIQKLFAQTESLLRQTEVDPDTAVTDPDPTVTDPDPTVTDPDPTVTDPIATPEVTTDGQTNNAEETATDPAADTQTDPAATEGDQTEPVPVENPTEPASNVVTEKDHTLLRELQEELASQNRD